MLLVFCRREKHRPRFEYYIVFSLLFALLTLTGCERQHHHAPVIAVISMTGGQLYWEQFPFCMQSLAASYGYEITSAAPQSESDYEGQASMVANAIDHQVSGIIIAPSHQLVLASILRHASNSGIAVVVAGAPIALEANEFAAYIGLDDHQAGVLAADRLIQLLHGRGNIAIVGVSPTLEAPSMREKAFADEIAAKSHIRLVSVKYGLSDWARARQATLDTLHENDIQGLFTSDEFSTLGALSVIGEMKNRPRFIGVGQEPDTVAGVRNGKIDAMIVSDPVQLGQAAMTTMHAVLTHKPYPKRQILPMKLLDASSLNDVAIQTTK